MERYTHRVDRYPYVQTLLNRHFRPRAVALLVSHGNVAIVVCVGKEHPQTPRFMEGSREPAC